METITDLIKGVSVPRMVKIREVFDDTHIPVNMIADMVNAELSREALGGQVKPGMRIAITCGSRGMSNNAVMAKAIVFCQVKRCRTVYCSCNGQSWWRNC